MVLRYIFEYRENNSHRKILNLKLRFKEKKICWQARIFSLSFLTYKRINGSYEGNELAGFFVFSQ